MNITEVVDNVIDKCKMFYKYSLFRTSSKLKGATDSERSNRFDLKLNIERWFSIFITVRLVSDVVHYFSGKDKQHLQYDIDEIVLGRDKRSFSNPYYEGKGKRRKSL